jgi:hypothetical protein
MTAVYWSRLRLERERQAEDVARVAPRNPVDYQAVP